MRIEIIKTHRLHHIESSSVDHISFACGYTLLTAVVLAREDRSLGALNREERSTLFRLCAVVPTTTTTENPPDLPRPAISAVAFPSDSFYPAALSRATSVSSSHARPCLSRILAAPRGFSRPSRVAYNRPTDRRAERMAGVSGRVRIEPSTTERRRSNSERRRPTNSRVRDIARNSRRRVAHSRISSTRQTRGPLISRLVTSALEPHVILAANQYDIYITRQ